MVHDGYVNVTVLAVLEKHAVSATVVVDVEGMRKLRLMREDGVPPRPCGHECQVCVHSWNRIPPDTGYVLVQVEVKVRLTQWREVGIGRMPVKILERVRGRALLAVKETIDKLGR